MAKDIKFNIRLNIDGKEHIVSTSASVAELRDTLDSTKSSAQRLTEKFFQLNQGVQGLQNVTSAISQLTGVLNGVTQESRTFSAAMKAANTMAGKDAQGFERMKDQVSDLSKNIPIARDLLANGLYQVISNGVPEDNWISFLNKSARSSIGGIANLEEVVKVTSTVIKNYGLEWEAAGDIQDKIQLTAKNGVTSFEQLAAALPSVTGQAAQLGVSFTEMLAVMSTLTGVTGNTSEVSTQLASVLTALTKESSKAQKMAADMGIEFNAASIKAAGGLRNYLQELDKTVTAYAAKSGELKESIYSKLFGRAEALRLVNSLTGEMAEKFDENIRALDNSMGTMDAAFDNMASTGASKLQLLKNKFSEITDYLTSVFGPALPVLNFSAQVWQSIIAVVSLTMAFNKFGIAAKAATIVTYAQTAAGKVASAVQFLWAKQLYYGRQAQIAWTFSAKLATVQAIAMRAAIMGLMAVTGIGLAFVAVSSVISLFASKTDDATQSMQDAEAEAKRLQEAQNEENQAGAQAAATLELQKEKLKNLIEAKKTGKDVSSEEKKIVGELNDAYGDTMGYFDSVSKWYDALIANSEDYCRQMVIEAKTRRLANQIAEKEAETHSLIYDESGKKKLYSTEREIGQRQIKRTGNGNAMNALQNSGVNSIEYFEIPGTSELDKVNQQIRDNNAQVKDLQKQMQDAVAEAAKLDFKVKGSATRPATTITPTGSKNNKNGQKDKQLIENAKTYKDLANNVAYYQQELEKCDITDTERIVTLAKAKKAAEDAVKAFKDMTDAATMPVELNTLDDYDKKLNALRNDRKTASKEHIAQIDAEIERIEAAKQALEDESVAALKDEEIRTYDQLNKRLAYYNRLLKSGDATQREFAQQGINRLNELQEAWDEALDAMSLPTTTNNLKDIDAAISFYTARQQKEDADQIQKTQAIIDGLTAKKKALQLGIELPNMQREIAEVNALTGHEYKVRIKGFGFDELTKKIRELQKILNDTQNPVTDSQRKDIEAMIATYEQGRKQSISAFGTFKDGWNGIKGIGSGIESITNALEGNGNAWQTITAFVDGFISIVEGINTVIGIIDLLTVATTAHTVAKGAESAATVTATTAQGVEAATQEAAAAAAIPVIIANKAATASYMELASAMFFAAHAAIPFAGFGIAAGFITAAAAMVQAIGLMPFADGAVVSGPTMALIGEYAGASNNPEVVAPLDKLRDMIEPQGAFAGKVRFEIEGRKLVGIIEKEYNHTKRS